ncbi:NAD(P)H-binding protein [Phytohabitans aurantiacus]|uniref:Nucleotide-diphosphate-sugar epimerase n=1 Tax=Phytohabitans aurantiacus TaxID=3016789 RepID=A0ABQ5QMD7_9ACTN|nr:NAD(P)H-binding protein [Phytohabitans aurantiacus]GLH95713.1 nucleotide-diphosphate-sugar epimerase [Phytohabitans aurantiacus]
MTTLITGARGNVGGGVLRRLHAAGHALRASSREPGRLDVPEGIETVLLDLAEPDTFESALRGITQVFLYAEPEGVDEFVGAAEAAGVKHIVLLSSSAALSPTALEDPLGRHHILVERALLASSISTTLLRPDAFAGNAFGWLDAIRSGGPVEQAYPDANVAPVHEDDIADVAAAALTEDWLVGHAITLTGPRSISLREQITIVAGRLGRDIAIHELTRAEAEEKMARYMPAEFVASLLDFWAGAVAGPAPISDAEWVTCKPARTFEQWVEEHIH